MIWNLSWTVLRWTLVVSVASLVGVVCVLAWDWLFWRRIPHARWRIAQSPREANIIREITRIRRIKEGRPDSSIDGGTGTEATP